MERELDITICIFAIIIFSLFIFLHHNAKVNCEKSGGFLVSHRAGKTYRYECVKL